VVEERGGDGEETAAEERNGGEAEMVRVGAAGGDVSTVLMSRY
jgi:hypothetical protein